jgi:hypothetical protein
MDFDDNNIPSYEESINRLINASISPEELKVLQYTAGLKALLDVLPDDTEGLSDQTVENYLWVIELLLQSIYDSLQDHTGKEA